MTPKVDHRLEALKELGAMIAADYRRRMANGFKAEADSKRYKADAESESNFEIVIRLHDPECDGLYTETVKVENFLRNRKYRAKKLLMRQTKTTNTVSEH